MWLSLDAACWEKKSFMWFFYSHPSGNRGCLKNFWVNISPFFSDCSSKNWSNFEFNQSEGSIWIFDQFFKERSPRENDLSTQKLFNQFFVITLCDLMRDRTSVLLTADTHGHSRMGFTPIQSHVGPGTQ